MRNLYKERFLDGYHRIDTSLPPNERIITAYRNFYGEWRSLLGHYFRTLYHIISFVHNSQLNEYDKTCYINIARAQLSAYELALIFYNGLWGEGKKGFKPLIEQYGLLKHVAAEDLLFPNHKDNPDYYNPSAFQGREERGVFRSTKEYR